MNLLINATLVVYTIMTLLVDMVVKVVSAVYTELNQFDEREILR